MRALCMRAPVHTPKHTYVCAFVYVYSTLCTCFDMDNLLSDEIGLLTPEIFRRPSVFFYIHFSSLCFFFSTEYIFFLCVSSVAQCSPEHHVHALIKKKNIQTIDWCLRMDVAVLLLHSRWNGIGLWLCKDRFTNVHQIWFVFFFFFIRKGHNTEKKVERE